MVAEDMIAVGRAAFAHQDWATARTCFRAVEELAVADLRRYATACWWLGLVEETLELDQRVHEVSIACGDLAGAALAAIVTGFCEVVRGRQEEGAGWLARARRLLADLPDAVEHGHLLAIDAMGALDAGALDEAEELATRVMRLGDHHTDPTLQAEGLFLRGEAAVRGGHLRQGRLLLDEAMLQLRTGEVLPEWAGNLYCRMMQLCHEQGDLPRAEHWTDVTELWCRGLAPATLFTGICRVHRVQLLHVQGQWARAQREAERAARDLAPLDVLVAGEAHYLLGELHRIRGDLEAAEAAYGTAHSLGRDPLPGMAMLHLDRGHRRAAAAMLDAALSATLTSLGRAPLLAARIAVALDGPPPQRVRSWLEELGQIAADHDSPRWAAEACRWRGSALLAHERYADALPLLREARERWQRIGAPHEVARVRLETAVALDGLGDLLSAQQERTEAAAALEHLGVRAELRRPRHRRPATAGHGLSPREVEVVAAVADGATNREVAARLYISERTVARHLANVYLKTGVTSRTAAVAWARDRALIR